MKLHYYINFLGTNNGYDILADCYQSAIEILAKHESIDITNKKKLSRFKAYTRRSLRKDKSLHTIELK